MHVQKQVISNLAVVHGRALKPPFDSKEEPMKSIYLSIVGTPTAAWRLPLQTVEGINVRGWQIATVSQCSEMSGVGGHRK